MLMSNLFHNLDSSAFRRWEMASFDEKPLRAQAEIELSAALEQPMVPQISEAELAQIREQAQQDGYAAGYQEAYARGLQEGQQAGYAASEENMKPELDSIARLVQELNTEIGTLGKTTAEQVLALAVSLAEQLVRSKIECDQQVIIGVVQEAIDSLPSIQMPAQLILNPIDLGIVKNAIGDQLMADGWRLQSDPTLERGGCRIETSQNLIDSSLAVRWESLKQALHDNSGH